MEFQLPELGEGVYEAELVNWLVQPGDPVKHGQSLMEVMTDKATMEVPSPFTGSIKTLEAKPGQQLKVGEVVLTYAADAARKPKATDREEGKRVKEEREESPEKKAVTRQGGDDGKTPVATAGPQEATTVKAAPSVRLMARQLGIDLAKVQGSGPGGRILIEDLSKQVAPPAATLKRPTGPEFHPEYGTPGTRIKVQGLRRIIAERMVQSKRTVPHYSYVDECEVTDMVRLREALRPHYDRAGVKLTYLAFFVKAAAAALKEVPMVNASLDEQAGEIVLHDHYHVGIAVATANGLMVPVIRDAEQKDLMQIAREVQRLSSQARAGKARLDDLRGSTFTITSIGGIGGLFSAPVINYPEVGIMGTGKVVKRPIFDAAGNVRPADMIYLSFSFDHRVVDGAVGAAFGNTVIRHLKDPVAFLVEGKTG